MGNHGSYLIIRCLYWVLSWYFFSFNGGLLTYPEKQDSKFLRLFGLDYELDWDNQRRKGWQKNGNKERKKKENLRLRKIKLITETKEKMRKKEWKQEKR